ncbi:MULTISPECIES: class I SAM-dependent methyltransferase [unclassified Leifsonia]|uniref:class I SAM-dependent methyltransferase n=1 Tax=unclassified Leifsonia TaxID=2663824 RepID=UPI0006F2D5D4|nr:MULTISPECIES: class I SAM-dependent methyltransferase [unclassified Leifsonia]KQX08195.1 methyltransferase type 11 [Leifsonia sp. Root1293]KRA12477.1 methyltransferase type 11 [Leifsonia sp. Root60]
MVDGADADGWSQVAQGWAELWGSFADPARRAIISAAAIGPGTRVLDAGCGSGEFLGLLADRGADAVGADPAPAMVALARAVVPGAEVVLADIEDLPFPDAAFDVATAVNALQFADDTTDAVRELARVVRPGGFVAVANWAEAALNDIDVVEAALAEALDDETHPDGPLRPAGGIEAALAAGGLDVVSSGVVDVPWFAADDDTLVRGILLGEDDEVMASLRQVIVAAAAPFRDGQGGYVLRNSFRWAVARV